MADQHDTIADAEDRVESLAGSRPLANDILLSAGYESIMPSEKDRIFPPMKPEGKADRTTQAVRAIAEADRVASEKKTAKLKALRLARDAQAALNGVPAKTPKG